MVASIPSPSANGLQVGPIELRAYGLLYALALIAAVAITARRWEARRGPRELVYEVALWGFPAGLIGGRLYYLATSWDRVPDEWWGPLAVWKGGLGIWGGIALGTAVGIWRLRRHGADVAAFLDAAAPALLVAQAIGRVGNYFNQELFGGPTNLPWGLEIDAAHRPDSYAAYNTFHPTFLYELSWNLGLAAFLVWLGHHRAIRPPGLFALYVAGYSGFRIFEELLRTDPAHHILGLRLNFFVATVLCLTGLVWFARIQRSGSNQRRLARGGPAALGLALLVMTVSGCTHAARAQARTGWPQSVTQVAQPALHPGELSGAGGRVVRCALGMNMGRDPLSAMRPENGMPRPLRAGPAFTPAPRAPGDPRNTTVAVATTSPSAPAAVAAPAC